MLQIRIHVANMMLMWNCCRRWYPTEYTLAPAKKATHRYFKQNAKLLLICHFLDSTVCPLNARTKRFDSVCISVRLTGLESWCWYIQYIAHVALTFDL